MADLTAKTAAHGLEPIAVEDCTLREAALRPIWSIAPFRGRTEAAEKSLGKPFPGPGGVTKWNELCLIWTGKDQAFLIGAEPDAALAEHAALTEQTDAWAHLIVEGHLAGAVLSRLVPVDVSARACREPSARRTLLGHMQIVLIADGPERFEILVFRSMAGTAVHELSTAMTRVARIEAVRREEAGPGAAPQG